MNESDVVIRVEGLGKKYCLRQNQDNRKANFRETLASRAKAAGLLINPFTLGGQLRKAQNEAAKEQAASDEEFWALKDVSFEIGRGERVGIIGRNGAGKSTLLKILSRITEPTTGRVDILGRVASLLEVGTGFHPELTGRENIYLNGAILGMTRRETRASFDKIVEFAEVEKFLDTPVKRYSSGMYVRLAFSVAAHLEPDILMVDEVLSVGDVNFQDKCLGKLKDDKSSNGRTVIFVSHNISALESLCSSSVLLENGKLTFKGSTSQGISLYLSKALPQKRRLANIGFKDSPRENAQVLDLAIEDADTNGPIRQGSRIRVSLSIYCDESISKAGIKACIYNSKGVGVIGLETCYSQHYLPFDADGFVTFQCTTESAPLNPGTYYINVAVLSNNTVITYIQQAQSFEVLGQNYFGTSRIMDSSWSILGLKQEWTIMESKD